MSSIRYSQLDLEEGSEDNIMRRTDSVESQVDEQLGEGFSAQRDVIQPESGRYPYCIVWTPLPLISWIFPFIGHMGIANSMGVIRDFAGSYQVNEDDMAFGTPTRYIQLDPRKVDSRGKTFNQAVHDGSAHYQCKTHNLCCQNCHSHVAHCLNLMQYDGRENYNMFTLALWIFMKGHYVGTQGLVRTWLPFAIVVAIALLTAAIVS